MVFDSKRDKKASWNGDSTSKPSFLFEALEPRILLSADGLHAIVPDPLHPLIDNIPQVIQYAELPATSEQVEEQAQSDTHNIDIYPPILTLSPDNESTETTEQPVGLDEVFDQEVFALTSQAKAEYSTQNSTVVIETTVDKSGNHETTTTTEDKNLPVNSDENLSTEEATSIEIRGPPAIEGVSSIIDDEGANLTAAAAPVELLEADGILTYEQLAPIVEEAINRWSASELVTGRGINLDQVAFTVVDLEGDALGEAAGDVVYIDSTAAGYGWFVDTTPSWQEEYLELDNHQLIAESTSVAYGRMDLLTVVMHELGHVIGLEDIDPEDYPGELMAGALRPGQRRLIGSADELASSSVIHNFASLSGLNITTYTVDSLADVVALDGVVTLREAIEAANTNVAVNEAPAGSDTEVDVIQFNPYLTGGTIILSGTEFSITDDLDIRGLGADNLTIDAADSSRIFDVGNAVTASISGLHITGGNDSQGGAIRNSGILALSQFLVEGNQSTDAGVIYNSGTLTIDESTISDNICSGSTGGAVVNDGVAGILVVTGSLLYNNNGVDGAGIRNVDGGAAIINSTISGNTATGPGGGIL